MDTTYVVYQGPDIALKQSDKFTNEEIVLSPKLSCFYGRAYAGFDNWNSSEATGMCSNLFSAWQTCWLLTRLESVSITERIFPFTSSYDTVPSLVEAFEGRLEDEETWDLLAHNFGTSREGLRALFAEARLQYPSAFEVLNIWPKLDKQGQSIHLPELKSKIEQGVIENSHLLRGLVRNSEREVEWYIQWDQKARESADKLNLKPDDSLRWLLNDIGVNQLVNAAGEPYVFEGNLDDAVATRFFPKGECRSDGAAPLELFARDRRGVHHPNFKVRIYNGTTISGRLLSVTWKHHGHYFFLAMEFEDSEETIQMTVKGLRMLGTLKKGDSFWQRLTMAMRSGN